MPRSEEKRKLIVEEWKRAQKEGHVILGDKVRIARMKPGISTAEFSIRDVVGLTVPGTEM